MQFDMQVNKIEVNFLDDDDDMFATLADPIVVYEDINHSIYLGRSSVINDHGFLKYENIKTILCVGPKDKNINPQEGISYIDIILENEYNPKNLQGFRKYINMVADLINEKVKDGNVLIHCPTGNQLSPSLLAAHIIKYHNKTAREAIQYIKDRCFEAFQGDLIFLECLIGYEKNLKRNRKIKKNVNPRI